MRGAHATRRAVDGAAPEARRPIRLMIVDDSMVARAVLSRMLGSEKGFDIVGVAGTAEDAILALAQVDVDIVLLDLEMPGAGGLKMIPDILEAARGAKVMIVSSLAEEGAEETVAALALGAADTLPKPGTGRFNGRFSEVLVSRLFALGHAERPRRGIPPRPLRDVPLRSSPTGDVELVAIGASTGGIHALAALFQALPERIGVPLLITQHLPEPFMPVFARQLAIAASRPAEVATEGARLVADHVYIAPGDRHLTVERRGDQLFARLVAGRSASGCLPSVDPMLASVGEALGPRGLGVVLTGMGRDGAEGAARLVQCGGAVIAQDEASSAVWGMPRAVVEAGLACALLPPDKIARRIASRIAEAVCR